MRLKKVFLFSAALLAPLPCLCGETTSCPPFNPAGAFLQNFLNACYAFQVPPALSTGHDSGDLTETYSAFFYRVDPGYEILLVGYFPQSRFLDISVDDSHKLAQGSFYDAQLAPLVPGSVNPFLPGQTFVAKQLYVVAIQFGGTQPATVSPGCGYDGLNFYTNAVDATKRHPGLSWNGSPLVPPGFPVHDDLGPNRGGMVNIRQYLYPTGAGVSPLSTPVAIVRDLSTGCAVPVSQSVATDPLNVLPSQVLGRNTPCEQAWLDTGQISAHITFNSLQPTYCYQLGTNAAHWFRTGPYVPNPDPEAAYLIATLSHVALTWVVQDMGFMRIRFKLPATPSIPCDGCSLTGSEDLRYFDLSFLDNTLTTLATIGSPGMVTDPNGYVTLIIGFGTSPPPWVTPGNYYTYLDLSQIPGFGNLLELTLRTILPSANFACSAGAVNYNTSEDNSLGGFISPYVPLVDVMSAGMIPQVAGPDGMPDSCGLVPPEPPAVCTVPPSL